MTTHIPGPGEDGYALEDEERETPLYPVSIERTDTVDDPDLDTEDDPVLAAPCQAPGCPLRNGDHSPEEVIVCLERWLMAVAKRRAGR
jgi:hypothetical protein